jgi:hypothetical protein
MVKYFICSFFLIVLSCTSYYKNEKGIYEPNKPNYSLKDKKGFILPARLDTVNFYQYYGFYENEKINADDKVKDIKWCLKFFDNGRLLNVSKKKIDYEYLNPNFAKKEYYFYDKKNDIIKIESFVTAEGGQYIILKYKLSIDGDTLTSITDGKKNHVFIIEKIPIEWKRYNPDW